jgi:hypothetical protein
LSIFLPFGALFQGGIVVNLLASVSKFRSAKSILPAFCKIVFSLASVLPLAGCPGYQDPVFNISHYDPARAYDGTTYFEAGYFYPGYFAVDMQGNVLWSRYTNLSIGGNGLGLSISENGMVLAQPDMRPTVFDPENKTILWQDFQHTGHHSIAETPWGTILTLVQEEVDPYYPPWGTCVVLSDNIVEINVLHQTVWEWKLAEHVDPIVHHRDDLCITKSGFGDWSHCNVIKMIENYRYNNRTYSTVLLLLARNLQTFFLIDYPSGNILWSCGQHGTFGRREPPAAPLFDESHEVDMVGNNHFLLFDNGVHYLPPRSRALEIAVNPERRTATTYWQWTDPVDKMEDWWGGDANRLPNGNTLIANVSRGRLVEITRAGEKVWQLDMRHRALPEDETINTIYLGVRVDN